MQQKKKNGIQHLFTTGEVEFDVITKKTRDGRRFLALPHSNRVYEDDWGYRCNSMGKDGQRIGQFCLPIHRAFLQRVD